MNFSDEDGNIYFYNKSILFYPWTCLLCLYLLFDVCLLKAWDKKITLKLFKLLVSFSTTFFWVDWFFVSEFMARQFFFQTKIPTSVNGVKEKPFSSRNSFFAACWWLFLFNNDVHPVYHFSFFSHWFPLVSFLYVNIWVGFE